MFSLMSNLQTYYHFKLDFQKVAQHTGGKWLIQGTKRCKDNQLQSLEWINESMISSMDQAESTGPQFNIKTISYQYRKSHCGDKTILRPSYLHNGISYTGKTTSLYWIRAQIIIKATHYIVQWLHWLAAWTICIFNTFLLVYTAYARYGYSYWQCA